MLPKYTTGRRNHFIQFGGCKSDHSGDRTVQDTLFQLQAQNRSAKRPKASIHVTGELERGLQKLPSGQAQKQNGFQGTIFFNQLSLSWVPTKSWLTHDQR